MLESDSALATARRARLVDAAARTDVGRVRGRNEDAVAVSPAAGIFVVADGMGGHAGGDVASALAAHAAYEVLAARTPRTSRPVALRAAFTAADKRVRGEAARRPALDGMGTTLVALLVQGDRATVGHCGDSRAYLWRGGVLTGLTRDHGQGHVVTRAIGAGPGPSPDIAAVALAPGDVLLLCSDGLSKPLGSRGIARVMAGAPLDCNRACEALIDATFAAGAPDNVTVVLARLG